MPEHSTHANLHTLLEAVDRIRFHVIKLQEATIRKTGICQLNNGILVIRREKVPARNVSGKGFIVHRTLSMFSTRTRSFSRALPSSVFNCCVIKKITVINCSSPTGTTDEYELDAFYYQLGEVVHNDKVYYKFVVNARIGTANESEYRIGNFGLKGEG
ncbi:unnamed protein product [Angiostrongylus costaricensis]|uniref:Ephrin RBD domain-containing protein n=1 Tax=Angiostrongylus costaricensis TaxID=334426 RepID=A0A0R3PYF9_ANGCS|nr:unnamed protein product [Angiostrongylus costaricensis]